MFAALKRTTYSEGGSNFGSCRDVKRANFGFVVEQEKLWSVLVVTGLGES